MKRISCIGTIIAAGLTAQAVRAESYSIDWFTIDGGGTSTGGVYSVSGTIGQLDAGQMSGDGFAFRSALESW